MKRETVVGDIYEKIETSIECGVSEIDEMRHPPWCSGCQGGRILWGVRATLVLAMERMQSKLATTGLIVAASMNVHVTVDVLSLHVRGACQADFLYTSGKVASCRTRTASSRS